MHCDGFQCIGNMPRGRRAFLTRQRTIEGGSSRRGCRRAILTRRRTIEGEPSRLPGARNAFPRLRSGRRRAIGLGPVPEAAGTQPSLAYGCRARLPLRGRRRAIPGARVVEAAGPIEPRVRPPARAAGCECGSGGRGCRTRSSLAHGRRREALGALASAARPWSRSGCRLRSPAVRCRGDRPGPQRGSVGAP